MARKTARDEELSGKQTLRDDALKVYRHVEQAFTDQSERTNRIVDAWEAYNCVIGDKQVYNGNSSIFLPLISNAVNARKTRYLGQLFPQSGRHIEVISTDGDDPTASMSIAEHYVRTTRLRTEVSPALSVTGDCEGQYSLYVDWKTTARQITRRVQKPVKAAGVEIAELEPVETIETKEEEFSGPTVEIIHDADLMVLPTTADSIEEAIDIGGSVTVQRRWTKGKLRQMIDNGDIEEDAGEALLENMSKKSGPGSHDTEKDLGEAAGIRQGKGGGACLVYEIWTRLKVDGKRQLCRIFVGGPEEVLGIKRCPYWCDLPPVLSMPVTKLAGVFKGRPPVEDALDLQYHANDMVNAAADTAYFSAMPIVMTDPEKNPRTGTMILGLAAVWETSPSDTQFAQFPPLWKDTLALVADTKAQVYEILNVNPSMLPQQTGTRAGKRNQAEIALEQQVDLLTTADAVTTLERLFSELASRFILYDHQFRTDEMAITAFGPLGNDSRMEEVGPLALESRYEIRWSGVEQARNVQQIQQQIAFLNVLRSIPPQMLPGYSVNAAPVLKQATEAAFGNRIAPQVLVDQRKRLSVDPEKENAMLEQGFDVQVHPMDDDVHHMEVHMQLVQDLGDPTGHGRIHIQMHQMQMAAKAQAAQAQQQGGQPGGGGQTPPGAQPGTPRMKQQPGSMHQDRMPAAGAVSQPRKT